MKIINVILIIAVVIFMGSCNNKQKPATNNADSSAVAVHTDNAVFGICGEGSAMNTLQIITDTNDTLNLSVYDAKENNKVFGGYMCGDRMAALVNSDKNVATWAVDITTLYGIWLNAGSTDTGINIKDKGVAETVGKTKTAFKSWSIVNGQLSLTQMSNGKEVTNAYDLVRLDNDSLVYTDSKQMFKYVRRN